MYVRFLSRFVKNNAIVQGGAFRLDKGPTQTELNSFRHAIILYEECQKQGKNVHLSCIINDLGIAPEQRPKKSEQFEWPAGYLELLQLTQVRLPDIEIAYETTLRNQARNDLSTGKISSTAFTVNENTGVLVATCPAIMGRYYLNVARAGYTQQVGFYAQEPKYCDDNSCPLGPSKGGIKEFSGYLLSIEVLNYWIYADGRLSVAGHFEPKTR